MGTFLKRNTGYALCFLAESLIEINHTQLGGDVDASAEAARHRAEVRMEAVYPFHCGPLLGGNFQCVNGVNPLDDQHIAVFFDFSTSAVK